MQWADFGPYVLPYVIGCPEPVMQHHARLTAIDFCRRTLCDTRVLDPVVTDGTGSVEMEADSGLSIVKVKKVTVQGREFQLVTPSLGQELQATDSQQEFCYTLDNKVLVINPVQEAGLDVVVTAALAPTLTATRLDPAVATEYAQDIAHGIVSAIMRIPGQSFTAANNTSLAIQQAAYAGRVSTVAAKVARGTAGAKMRHFKKFF
jgi:hypothetical protein